MTGTVDQREDIVNEIVMYLTSLGAQTQDAANALYMILNKYEITSRCTEVAIAKQDRNDFLLKKFLTAKIVKGCTDRTIEEYNRSIRLVLRHVGKTVDEITADDIRYYMAIRSRRDKVSNVTIANEMRDMSSFFGWLHAEELVQRNPMNRVDRIKQKKTKKEALTEEEIERMRLAARGEREQMIIEVLLSTGCRVSEFVQILLAEIEGDRILVHGKGNKDRYVYLNAKARIMIERYLKERKDTNPYLNPGGITAMAKQGIRHKDLIEWWKNPNYIREDHIDKCSIEATLRKIAKRAGVERANPHKFRRTCATMALRRGMPIEQVSKMLGHEQISTTQIYLDLSEDDLKMAHKKYVI